MRAEDTLRRRIIAFACVTLFGACTDSVGPLPPPPAGLIVSNPVLAGALASAGALSASRSDASPSAADSLVYVSLTPGTASGGSTVESHHCHRGEASVDRPECHSSLVVSDWAAHCLLGEAHHGSQHCHNLHGQCAGLLLGSHWD